MSDSNRRGDLALGLTLGAFAGLFVGGFIWGEASTLEEYAYQKSIDHRTEANEYASEQIAVECVQVDNAEQAECARDKQQAARDQHTKYDDLRAQEIMAAWTRAMGQAALVAMIVGLFGLGLLYTTFRETRRAAEAGLNSNRIARENAERQLRPYVHVEDVEPKDPLALDDGITVKLKNFGQTPAIEPTIKAGFIYCANEANVWPIPDRITELDRDIAPGHTQRTVVPVKEEWIAPVSEKKGQIRIVLALEYSGFGIDDHHTLLAKIHYTAEGPMVALRNA